MRATVGTAIRRIRADQADQDEAGGDIGPRARYQDQRSVSPITVEQQIRFKDPKFEREQKFELQYRNAKSNRNDMT